MIIIISVSDRFHHHSVHEQQFQLDIDPNQNVENLKVLITLRFVDLGPDQFNLQCVATNQVLLNETPVHTIIKNEMNQIHVQIVPLASSVCNLI
ncbi:unnamed protein product [Paramecium pentaurelia]|uniref:Uncharacterized protein n=1 Tax=Paramecium pentaurelia TaxID=43138 RepID=A0A8S1UZW5_9CILI|nr:unnamed protein product [Paramecium pentaurelia]